jgi:predicted DNA binding CopG/RHH family protein
MKKKAIKEIPKFNNEDEEREFWAKANTLDYLDLSKAIVNAKFPNLKHSTETITIRFPKPMLEDLKIIANKKDVPYQSLIKMYLSEIIRREKLTSY